jgi:hypothetical protein
MSLTWRIRPRDVETGLPDSDTILRHGLTTIQVATWLTTAPLIEQRLLGHEIESEDWSNHYSGAEFMAMYPAEFVVAAWTAGGPAARTRRQDELHQHWPNLAVALDSLWTKHA